MRVNSKAGILREPRCLYAPMMHIADAEFIREVALGVAVPAVLGLSGL